MTDNQRTTTGGYPILLAGSLAALIFCSIGAGVFFGSTNLSEGPSPSEISYSNHAGQAERPRVDIASADREKREWRDLAAQEDMASWAFWLLLVSIASACITGIGTYFLFRQIALTQRAVEDTARATEIMVRQNDLTEASQRAWLALQLELVGSAEFTDAGLHFDAYIVVKNVGLSPATNVYLKLDVFNQLGPSDGSPQTFVDACRSSAESNNLDGFVLAPNEETRHYRGFKLLKERFPIALGRANTVLPLVMVSATYRRNGGVIAQTAKAFVIERLRDPIFGQGYAGQAFVINSGSTPADRLRVRHGNHGAAF